MHWAERVASVLCMLIGGVHLAVGYRAFVEPSEPRIWFASAGFLLILTGLTNMAAERSGERLTAVAALVGSASILLIAGMFAAVSPNIVQAPQSVLLIALGLFLFTRRALSLRPRNAPA